MLSVVIATRDSVRALTATLSMLVPGAMRGVVREVIIADNGSGKATIDVAEAAGCSVIVSDAPIGARFATAAQSARADWLMFLRPGTILEASWIDEIVPFIERADQEGEILAAIFRSAARAKDQNRLVAAAAVLLGRRVGTRPHPDQGLIIGAHSYKELGGHPVGSADPETDLLTRIGRRRIVTLHSAARR